MDASQPSGKPMRLVSRQALFQAFEGALAESLASEGHSPGAIQRARRKATRAFVARLKSRSKRVRGLSRAEFLAELEQSRSRFAVEKERTERELAELAAGDASGQHDRVDILERRVAKMRAALAELEGDYAELARRAAEDPGLRSVYRELQGGATGVKKKLLGAVLAENLELKASLEARRAE
jgi:hypothetical protein